jgi:peptide deformylase
MDILHYPSPVLKAPAEKVADPAEVAGQVEAMVRTMHEHKGVGLAATQVGISKQICIINVEGAPGKDLVLVNPELIEGRGEASAVEGCLSLPGLEMKVKRYEWVKIRATTLDGQTVELEGDGLFARAVQHEMDHLSGKLIIDRVNPVTKIALRPRLKEMERKFKNKA